MRKSIYVVSQGAKWKVQCEHCQCDILNTQFEAVSLAKKHTAQLPQGALSHILIQGDSGKFIEEWTYGQDPFPPKG